MENELPPEKHAFRVTIAAIAPMLWNAGTIYITSVATVKVFSMIMNFLCPHFFSAIHIQKGEENRVISGGIAIKIPAWLVVKPSILV